MTDVCRDICQTYIAVCWHNAETSWHLDHVLIVYSLTHHMTWKSPGPMCGWVGRILHPNLCTSVSSWSEMPLLSIWSVAVPLCRPLLPCPSRWHGSLPWHVCDGWLVSYTALLCSGGSGLCTSCESPLLSCVPWSSDWTSCLSLQHMSWSSSCKGHDRSIQFSLHPWPCPLDEPQSSVAFGEEGDAVRFQNSSKCLAQSFHIRHNNHTFVIAACSLLSLLRPSKISPRCLVWPYRWSWEYVVVTMNFNKSIMSSTVRRILVWSFITKFVAYLQFVHRINKTVLSHLCTNIRKSYRLPGLILTACSTRCFLFASVITHQIKYLSYTHEFFMAIW